MVRWRSGTVTAVRRRWRGAVELTVRVAGEVAGRDEVRALAYPDLVGEPSPGDRVLLNVGALAMGLGTGGYALVVALPDRVPADPPSTVDSRDAGHLVKARYTPLQAIVLGVDEEASPHHDTLVDADDLDGMPVVTADLHSALPAVLAGLHAQRPDARVAYLMTDGGALPAWFSRTLDALGDRLVGTVTAGQAFGGDLESTTVHSGLLAARHVLRADVTVVAQGPGNLGTGTRWGFSGVSVGEAVNATAVLGGRPVGSLRISAGDARPRHRGLSHHSVTAYGRVALRPADLVVPDPLPADLMPADPTRGPDPTGDTDPTGGTDPTDDLVAGIEADLADLGRLHRVVRVGTTGLLDVLRASPVPLSTMGRGLDQDTAYFLAAAAAGRHAGTLLA